MRPFVNTTDLQRANAAAWPSQPETRDIDKVLDKIQFVIDASLEIGRIGVGRTRQPSITLLPILGIGKQFFSVNFFGGEFWLHLQNLAYQVTKLIFFCK